MRILIVPGFNGSGSDHWQTLWERQYDCERVHQRDWVNPDVVEWVEALDAALAEHGEQAVIVAHSLGCLTVAQWARTYPARTPRVRCALLVAPPDVDSCPNIPASIRKFALQRPILLPFPSVLVSSENDPYMTAAAAWQLARLWGCRFVNAGAVGHINTDSNHGPWPEGEALLRELIDGTAVLSKRVNSAGG